MSEIDNSEHPLTISLYKTLEEKGKYLFRTTVLKSVIIVGRISLHVTDQQEIKRYFESLVLKYKAPNQITGILLVYPNHVINILETSSRTLMDLINILNKSEKIITCYIDYYMKDQNNNLDADDQSNIIVEVDKNSLQTLTKKYSLAPIIRNRLLCVLDNIIYRIYRSYEVAIINMESIQILDYNVTESDENILMDMLSQINQLSVYLAEEPMKDTIEYVPEIFKIKLNNILKTIRETHPAMIPQENIVAHFADSSTYKGIIPLQEYLHIYKMPYETSLQSGMLEMSNLVDFVHLFVICSNRKRIKSHGHFQEILSSTINYVTKKKLNRRPKYASAMPLYNIKNNFYNEHGLTST